MTGPEHRAARIAALEAEVAALRERLVRVEPDAFAARVLRGDARPSPVRRPGEGRTGARTPPDPAGCGAEELRIGALEDAVRELNDRLDDPEPHVRAAEAERVASILARWPDLRDDGRTLG